MIWIAMVLHIAILGIVSGDPKKALLRRQGRLIDVKGGIDFSNATFDEETGRHCIFTAEQVDTIEKEPILECTHKNVEQCHYTYITQFVPSQEEICEENYQKKCQITFQKHAVNETVEKCYKPIEKVCNGEGPEECRTIYESSCTTKYLEKSPGKFVGDTKCEKLPFAICGAGCEYEEGEEDCHDTVVASLVEIPEEVCDLNPQKTCRFSTKLVPKLIPEHQCTLVPKETCNLRFSNPRLEKKPLLTKWCLDEESETDPSDDEIIGEESISNDAVATLDADIYDTIDGSSSGSSSPALGIYGSPDSVIFTDDVPSAVFEGKESASPALGIYGSPESIISGDEVPSAVFEEEVYEVEPPLDYYGAIVEERGRRGRRNRPLRKLQSVGRTHQHVAQAHAQHRTRELRKPLQVIGVPRQQRGLRNLQQGDRTHRHVRHTHQQLRNSFQQGIQQMKKPLQVIRVQGKHSGTQARKSYQQLMKTKQARPRR